MKRLWMLITLLAALVLAGPVGTVLDRLAGDVYAQGYSGAVPNVSAAAGTSLDVTYTAGTVTVGGAQNSITAGTTSLAASQTSCAAPAYTACNFVYWPGSGTAITDTTTFATAFAEGNVVIAFCTTTTDDVNVCTPASWNLPNTSYSVGQVSTTGSYFVSARNCFGFVSGNADTGNATYAVGGSSNHPEFQLVTTNSGTNTHTFKCDITPPTFLTSGRAASITSVDFYYGVQTTALGTQVATLASGTMNSQEVFQYVDYPAAGAAETPSTEVPVRADSGTLTITPTVGSFNVNTTTAGRYYTVTFTPATALAIETTRRQYYVNVALLNTATSGTETNTVGARVSYSILR